MHWKDSDGKFYQYRSSQQPQFKFNTYLLMLKALELIEYNSITDTYTMTTYAKEIL